MTILRTVCWSIILTAMLGLAAQAADTTASAPAGEAATPANSAADKEYQDKAAKLTDKDAKGWLTLADFCEAQLLFNRREEALRKAASVTPENAEAHKRLDEVKVGSEWLPAAEAEDKAAKDQEAKGEVHYGKSWVPAKSAERMAAADRQQFGWDIKTRVDGAYCVVYSAASYQDTAAVAGVIDNVVAKYMATFGKARKANLTKPLPVHLFASAEAFASNFKRMTKSGEVPKGFAGGYNAGAKALFLSTDIGSSGWNLGTLLHTTAHETTHALDDLAAGMQINTIPTWISEGRAVYAQYSLVGRQLLYGAVNIGGTDGRGQDLEKAYKTPALDKLLSMDHKTFNQGSGPNYAVAWSFTYFLQHGQDGAYREKYQKFLLGCPQKCSEADFEKTVGKVSDLEGPYRIYVETVFLPAVKASVNADRKAKGLQGEWK